MWHKSQSGHNIFSDLKVKIKKKRKIYSDVTKLFDLCVPQYAIFIFLAQTKICDPIETFVEWKFTKNIKRTMKCPSLSTLWNYDKRNRNWDIWPETHCQFYFKNRRRVEDNAVLIEVLGENWHLFLLFIIIKNITNIIDIYI